MSNIKHFATDLGGLIRPHILIPLLILLALILAACGGSPTPEIIEREVEVIVTQVVTEIVEREVIVTQEVEVLVTPEPEEAAPEQPTPEPFVPDTAVIATGLFNPRQLFYGAGGTLYIAEAGMAGNGQVVVDPENTVGAGLTSQISMVAPDGTQSVALPALPSVQTSPGNTGFRGGQAIYVTDDSYWVAFGEGPAALQGLSFFRSVVQFDRETWRIGAVIDTGSGRAGRRPTRPGCDQFRSLRSGIERGWDSFHRRLGL